MRYIYFL